MHTATAVEKSPSPGPEISAAAAAHADTGAPPRRFLDSGETVLVTEDDDSEMNSEDLLKDLQANFNQEGTLRSADAVEAEAQELLDRAQGNADSQAAAPTDRYSPYPAEAGRPAASALAPFGKAARAASLA